MERIQAEEGADILEISDEDDILYSPLPSPPPGPGGYTKRQLGGPQLIGEDTLLLSTIPQPTPNNGCPIIAIEDDDTQLRSVQLPPARKDVSEDLDDEVIYLSSTVASLHEEYEIFDSDDDEMQPFLPELILLDEDPNLVQLSNEDMAQSLKSREVLSTISTAMVVIPSPTRYEGERNDHTANALNEEPESSAQFSPMHSKHDTLPIPKVPTWFDDPFMKGPSSRYAPVNIRKETSSIVSPMAHSHTKHSVDTISTSLRTSPIPNPESRIPQSPSPDTDNKYSSPRLSSRDEFTKTFEIIADYKRIINEHQSEKEEFWVSYWKTSENNKELISNIQSLKPNENNNINTISYRNESDVINIQSSQSNWDAFELSCSYLITNNTLSTDEQNLHESRDLSNENDVVTTKDIKKKQVLEVHETERIVSSNKTKKIHGTTRKNSNSLRGPSEKLQKWKKCSRNAGRRGHSNHLNLNTSNATLPSKHIDDNVCINQAKSKHNSNDKDKIPKNSRSSEIVGSQNNELQIQYASQSGLPLAGTSHQTRTEPKQKTHKKGKNKAKIKYDVKLKDDLKITITKRKNNECRKDDTKRRCSSDIPQGIEQIDPINTPNPTELQTSNLSAYNDSQMLNHQESTEKVRSLTTIPPLHESYAREDQQTMKHQNRNSSPNDFCNTKDIFHDEMTQISDLKILQYNVPPPLETPPQTPEYELSKQDVVKT